MRRPPLRPTRPAARAAAFALVLTLAAALLACGPIRPGADADDPIVMFDNQSIYQADVYAISSGGSRTRLGTVSSGRREALRIRSAALGGDRTLALVARLFASGRVAGSGRFTLSPGDTVLVTLSADGGMLSVLPR